MPKKSAFGAPEAVPASSESHVQLEQLILLTKAELLALCESHGVKAPKGNVAKKEIAILLERKVEHAEIPGAKTSIKELVKKDEPATPPPKGPKTISSVPPSSTTKTTGVLPTPPATPVSKARVKTSTPVKAIDHIVPVGHLKLIPSLTSLRELCKTVGVGTAGQKEDLLEKLVKKGVRYEDIERETLKEIAWALNLDVSCSTETLAAKLIDAGGLKGKKAASLLHLKVPREQLEHLPLANLQDRCDFMGLKRGSRRNDCLDRLEENGISYGELEMLDLWRIADRLGISVNIPTVDIIRMLDDNPDGLPDPEDESGYSSDSEQSGHGDSKFKKLERRHARVPKDDIWAYRDGRDRYSQQSRTVVEADFFEVDHVVEMQVLNHVYAEAARLRNDYDKLMVIVNGIPNLNITFQETNKAKGDLFRKFFTMLKENPDAPFSSSKASTKLGTPDTLEDLARFCRSASIRRMVDQGRWARIDSAICQANDEIIKKIADGPDSKFAEKFADKLSELLFDKMKLGS